MRLNVAPGRVGMFSGKVTVFNKARQLAQPDYQIVPGSDDPMDATISPADAHGSRRRCHGAPPHRLSVAERLLSRERDFSQ